MTQSPSPFARPMPGVRIKEGAPPIVRPSKAEIATYPAEAGSLLGQTWQAQHALLNQTSYDLDWMAGRHFLLAGATGPGIGGALATAVLNLMPTDASLLVLGRDLSKSINYETGKAMAAQAASSGWGDRFQWLNTGMALEGRNFEKIVAALKAAGANRVVYINTVAAASSGLLPGQPPVFVTDVDEAGIFQWQLTPLDNKAVEMTKFVMGTLAVEFTHALEAAGIEVEVAAFADWRGSRDEIGRDPGNVAYGRQGAYSTSLWLPKAIIQQAVAKNYGSNRKMVDIAYPVMRTRALPFIPGGMTMSYLYDELMRRAGIGRIAQPELALNTLQLLGQVLDGYDNPFPHLDDHELHLDEWFYQIVLRLTNDENSDFYYRNWLKLHT